MRCKLERRFGAPASAIGRFAIMSIATSLTWASACGDPAVYSRAPVVRDGTGGLLDPGVGGAGAGAFGGTGGQVAVGGGPGQGGGIGGAGGAVSPAASGGSSGVAGRSAAGGAEPGATGGTTASGGAPGTAGMAAAGGKGGAGGAAGALAAGSGGVGGGGRGGIGTGGAGGTGAGSGGVGGGGGSAAGGAGAAGAGGAPADLAKLSFETSSQNWFVAAGNFANLERTTVRHFAGVAALGATLQYTAGGTGVTNTLAVGDLGSTPPPGPGSVITFHVYLPASAPAIDWVQPFLQDSSSAYFGAYTIRQSLTFGDWNTIKLTVPSTAKATLHLIGVEVHTSGGTSLSDDVFVDSIDW